MVQTRVYCACGEYRTRSITKPLTQNSNETKIYCVKCGEQKNSYTTKWSSTADFTKIVSIGS